MLLFIKTTSVKFNVLPASAYIAPPNDAEFSLNCVFSIVTTASSDKLIAPPKLSALLEKKLDSLTERLPLLTLIAPPTFALFFIKALFSIESEELSIAIAPPKFATFASFSSSPPNIEFETVFIPKASFKPIAPPCVPALLLLNLAFTILLSV